MVTHLVAALTMNVLTLYDLVLNTWVKYIFSLFSFSKFFFAKVQKLAPPPKMWYPLLANVGGNIPHMI